MKQIIKILIVIIFLSIPSKSFSNINNSVIISVGNLPITYVDLIKEAQIMRDNKVDKNDLKDLTNMKKIFEKSIVTAKEINRGNLIDMTNIKFKKPGDGISASEYKNLIGRKINKDLLKDVQIKYEDLL